MTLFFRISLILQSKSRTMTQVKLLQYNNYPQLSHKIRSLYFSSFPPQERRLWEDIEQMLSQHDSPYNLFAIIANDKFAGLISWWNLTEFYYIEHFAIIESMRSYGVGTETLKQFSASTTLPIILEVELPDSGKMAHRRIKFYQRNGFTPHPNFQYIQPPYSHNLPPVPLMLMTANTTTSLNLQHIKNKLHNLVYKVSLPE